MEKILDNKNTINILNFVLKLFSIVNSNNENIIIQDNKKIFINDLEKLFSLNDVNSNVLFKYIFNRSRYIRMETGCDSKLYITFICYLLLLSRNFNNKFFIEYISKLVSDFRNFIKSLPIRNTIAQKKDIYYVFNINDEFFRKIIDYCYDNVNINIIENIHNNDVVSDGFYEVKIVNTLKKNIVFKNVNSIFLHCLDINLLANIYDNLLKLYKDKKYVLFHNSDDKEVIHVLKNLYLKDEMLYPIKIKSNNYYDLCNDLMCLSGGDNNFLFNFNDYNMGVFEVISIENNVAKFLNRTDCTKRFNVLMNRNTYESQYRANMLIGKNVKIYYKDKLLFEDIYKISHYVKSIYRNGVFYGYIDFIKLLYKFVDKNLGFKFNFDKCLMDCFRIFYNKDDWFTIFSSNNYNDLDFLPFEIYDKTFDYIISDLKMLSNSLILPVINKMD